MSNAIVDKVKNIMDIVCRLSTELGNPITEKDYIIEDRGCPHQSSQLPKGKCAVYMFFYKDEALKSVKQTRSRMQDIHRNIMDLMRAVHWQNL